MSKSKAYRSTEVKHVHLEEVLAEIPFGPVIVGVDIGKFEIFAVLRFVDGSFERPWKLQNPLEIELFVRLLERISERHPVTVAMESTGTYGDALRAELATVGLPVQRVGGKAAHDYAEIFDGVPSQHDGKDAAILAELAALGKARLWPCRQLTEQDSELAYWVDKLDAQQRMETFWTGKLEALLARHWPELTRLVDLSSVTLLSLVAHYGGPAAVAADAEARRRLNQWGRGSLKKETVDAILASAADSYGARQDRYDIQAAQDCAAAALAAAREMQTARERLKRLAEGNEVLRRMGAAVGLVTACVLWVALGDPANYHCGGAYRKAMGLNLKERSSGKYQGRLKLTKRGPSIVRRWLYMAALRTVQEADVKQWYEAKKKKDHGRGQGALVAVMRKLSLALYAVGARGETFDPRRLFPGRPWVKTRAASVVEA